MADLADELYRQFDPLRPLAADETALYVDWQRTVGIEDIKDTLVNAFVRSGDQNVFRSSPATEAWARPPSCSGSGSG